MISVNVAVSKIVASGPVSTVTLFWSAGATASCGYT